MGSSCTILATQSLCWITVPWHEQIFPSGGHGLGYTKSSYLWIIVRYCDTVNCKLLTFPLEKMSMPSPWLALALPPAAAHREGAPSPLPN